MSVADSFLGEDCSFTHGVYAVEKGASAETLAELEMRYGHGASHADDDVAVFTSPDYTHDATTDPGEGAFISLFQLAGWQWPASRIPISYYVNTSNVPSNVNVNSYVAAVDNSFDSWQAVTTGTQITFNKVGHGTQYGTGAADGMVTVGFGTATSGALAHATTYSDGQGVTEFDVVLGDDRATWSTTGGGSTADIWATTTHEVGHGLGLGHSDDTDASMYFAIYLGSTHQRDPNADDIAGLRAMYGDPGPAPPPANEAPTPPGKLTASNITFRKATISWKSSTDADGDSVSYQVRYRKHWPRTGTKSWIGEMATTTASSYRLKDLDSNATYDVWVRSGDGTNYSKWRRGNALFTTTSSNSAPEKPRGIIASEVTNTTAMVSWDASKDPEDDPVTYRLRYRPTGTTGWTDAFDGRRRTWHLLTDLEKNTSYDVRVVVADAELTEATNVTALFTTTNQVNRRPSPPENIAAAAATASTARVFWGASVDPNGDPLTYRVRFRETGTSVWAEAFVGISETDVVLTGLKAGVAYDVRIAATDGTLTTARNGIDILTTLNEPNVAPSKPGVLTASNIGETHADVNWGASVDPNPTTLLYAVWVRPTGTTSWSVVSDTVLGTTYTLTGLTLGETYDVRAVVTDGDHAIARTHLGLFTTTGNVAPDRPSGIAASNITGSSAAIDWQASNDLNGDSVTYRVRYRANGSGAGSGSWVDVAPNHDDNSYTLTGLAPSTLYDVRISASDGAVSAATNAIGLFTTTATDPSPAVAEEIGAAMVQLRQSLRGWRTR